jgi:hypothetical protein
VRRFKESSTSCEDKQRLGRPLAISGDISSKFLLKYPFASARMIAKHFDIRGSTVRDLLIRELGHDNSHEDGSPSVIGESEIRTSNPFKIVLGLTVSISRS